MLHCPKCDAIFEEQENACTETTCPRCGSIIRTSAAAGSADLTGGVGSSGHEEGAHLSFTHASQGSGFSLSGRPGILRWTKNVAVTLITSVCPGCGHKVSTRSSACPHCGRLLKKGSAPASTEFGSTLRKMLLAATVFIGLPAAVIVFVVVVCAPEGSDLGTDAQRSVPADRLAPRATLPGAEPQKANAVGKAEHRSPLSALRSIRDRLRGAEHGGSSVPAKAPLEKAGDRVGDAHVPPVGTRDGEQVKPDPIR
jgi:ribosomal protein L37AE/L43A